MMNSTEKSLPEKLSDDIIAYILEEQLQPNDKLPNESVLSEKMGAGRSSIREAMKLLASRNIVTIRQVPEHMLPPPPELLTIRLDLPLLMTRKS